MMFFESCNFSLPRFEQCCSLYELAPYLSRYNIQPSFEFDKLILILRCGDWMMKAIKGKGEWHLTLMMTIYSCLPLDRNDGGG